MSHDVLRKRLLERAGITNRQRRLPPFRDLYHQDGVLPFERVDHLCRCRMVTGRMRYGGSFGLPEHRAHHAKNVSSARAARKALDAYLEDANLDHVLDAINYLKIEFIAPHEPGARYEPTDDESHTGTAMPDHD